MLDDRRFSILALFLALSFQGCAAPAGSRGAAPPAAARSELDRRVRIVATRPGAVGGEELDLTALVERLADAEAVFFGETHVDETTHALQLAVYRGLVEATGGRVVLAMEMFARDAQPALDAYVAGELTEAEFLARSSPWSNYATGYRPLVELARERGLPVVGSNVPAPLRRKVSRGEAEAFAALTDRERAWIAPELLPNSEAYWKRFVRIVRGAPGQTTAPEDYLYTGQSLWDNTMGFSVAEALDARPGWLVLHVNGRFHTDHGQGTVEQLLLRRPGTRVATITATSVEDAAGQDLAQVEPEADFVALVQARGRGVQDGYHAVRTGHTRRFRLHVPEGASDAEPVPLLVWLTRDGVSADDELELWRVGAGERLAVAAVEPTYRALAPDLGPGGTWIHTETASADIADGIAAAREVRRYVERYYPVDPERVLVAGAATGGTVAAAGALAGDFELAAASDPERFRRLRTWGLPPDGGSERRLTVSAQSRDDREWWERELADYAPSGLVGLRGGAPASPVWVMVRLGVHGGQDESRHQAGIDEFMGARAHVWRETFSRSSASGPTWDRIDAALDDLPERLLAGEASGRVIPPTSGPFGGTTVLVAPADRAEAWLALEGSDVMSAHGGFQRLRVAVEGGSPSLSEVLAELHRKNVLIVPARFCEGPEAMAELRSGVEEHLAQMTAAFLPGLGGRLHLAESAE